MHRIFRAVLGMTMVALLGLTLCIQAQQTPAQQTPQAEGPKKNWKGQDEYDMYSAIVKETDGKKKLALLNAWKDKYPNTDFQAERLQLFVNTYQQLGDAKGMLQGLNDMLALNPKDVVPMYSMMLLMLSMGDTSPSALDQAEKVANSALANLDQKPASVKDADWPKGKKEIEALAHKTLGWAAMLRKQPDAAEQEFKKSLDVNPNQGEVDYWMGSVLIAQRKPEKMGPALYYIARAAAYEGEGAAPAPIKQTADAYLGKAYTQYHGDDPQGLQALKATAKAAPFPKPDFKIETKEEREVAAAAQKEQELRAKNPTLPLWVKIKEALTSADGSYWETMKGSLVPGGAEGVKKLKGTVISARPSIRPKELVVAIDGKTPDVTLKLDAPLSGKVAEGSDIEFEGVPTALSKNPFMVTFEVEKANVVAKVEPARAPVSKKSGAGTRKAGRKG